MKCKRIQFEGYRRLADTQCDVNQRLVAFVGQNEAGKSSVLSGLHWLSEEAATPLQQPDKSRANKKDSGWIVGARFSLGDAERNLISGLGLAEVPKEISLWKQAEDGRLHITFDRPKNPGRAAQPFADAAAAIRSVSTGLTDELDEDASEDGDGPRAWIETLLPLLDDPEHLWTDLEHDVAQNLCGWLSQAPEAADEARDETASQCLRTAADIGYADHPADTALDLVSERVPRFVLFEQRFRDLPTEAPIHDQAARAQLPPAIGHLLAISGLNVSALWAAKETNDTGEVETLLSQANANLDRFFGQAWNQSDVSVRFKSEGGNLQTHIYEIDNQRFTRAEERSDGLRAFIALAAFLEAQRLEVPPILLIDEAETHLHFDAQADLVGVLLKQVQATQIFYTTHSPGCLPSDLGTGIRLVQRDAVTSQLKSHFWTNTAPGFGPLLFAMGAGAAAFSACRWAVLAEGASEMVLLPTLLRMATGLDDLPYQIAPGLSNAHAYGMAVEEVAAKVVYLTDGDTAGKEYRDALLLAKVEQGRIFQLPDGRALEDLLEPEAYLATVQELMGDGAPQIELASLESDIPIARAVANWAERLEPSPKLAGKIAVAYAVLDGEVRLAPGADQTLQDLHASFVQALAL